MAKLTLNLDDAWAKLLVAAANDAGIRSVNEYLRQMIANDKGVQRQMIGNANIPPISKSWGRRKLTDDTEHTEVKPADQHSPFTQTYVADTNELTPHEITRQRKDAAQRKLGKNP